MGWSIQKLKGEVIDKIVRIVFIGTLFSFIGCATMKQSILTGVATGAATGMLVGPAVNRSAPDAKVGGALVGAAVGGIAAYLIHNGIENRDAEVRKETLFNLDKFNVTRPSSGEYEYGIASPQVETECFETEVRGNKLVQAHCESRITGTPEWVKNSNRKKELKQ